MLFNFTTKHQFSSRTLMDSDTVDIVKETKLLGVMIDDRLSWDRNTTFIVKRANSRMRLLHQLVDFSIPKGVPSTFICCISGPFQNNLARSGIVLLPQKIFKTWSACRRMPSKLFFKMATSLTAMPLRVPASQHFLKGDPNCALNFPKVV